MTYPPDVQVVQRTASPHYIPEASFNVISTVKSKGSKFSLIPSTLHECSVSPSAHFAVLADDVGVCD